MNALDLLVDFTTLVSIAVEPITHQNENVNTYIDPNHDAGPPPLTSEYSLSFEQCPSTQQMPTENAARGFTANTPSVQTLSLSTSYIPDVRMRHTEYQPVPPSFTPHKTHTAHTSNSYHHEDPNTILPSSLSPQPWHHHPQLDPSPQWPTYHSFSSLSPPASTTYYPSNPPYLFDPAQQQQQSATFQPLYPSWIQNQNYPDGATTWPPWSPANIPFDCSLLPEYNECTTISDVSGAQGDVAG